MVAGAILALVVSLVNLWYLARIRDEVLDAKRLTINTELNLQCDIEDIEYLQRNIVEELKKIQPSGCRPQ